MGAQKLLRGHDASASLRHLEMASELLSASMSTRRITKPSATGPLVIAGSSFALATSVGGIRQIETNVRPHLSCSDAPSRCKIRSPVADVGF